jgi:hypothetical protein
LLVLLLLVRWCSPAIVVGTWIRHLRANLVLLGKVSVLRWVGAAPSRDDPTTFQAIRHFIGRIINDSSRPDS